MNKTVNAGSLEITNTRTEITKPIVGYCALCGRALSPRQFTLRDYYTAHDTTRILHKRGRMICRARGLCARRQEQQRKEKA